MFCGQHSISKPMIATISRTGIQCTATSSWIEQYYPGPQYTEKSEPKKPIQYSGQFEITSSNKPGEKPFECQFCEAEV
jgi:DNA-binding winged helix-turn-helix (wHTH) protein